MPKQCDITINIPSEYFDELSQVIEVGIQRSNIDLKIKKELKSWWEAEKEFAIENKAL